MSENPKCPECGSRMVKKVARKGRYRGNEFFGCQWFPSCKGIVNIPKSKPKKGKKKIEEEPKPKEINIDVKEGVEAGTATNTSTQSGTPLTDRHNLVLSKLRDQLLDISTRNRSVRLNRIYDHWGFDLSMLIPFDGKEFVNELIESALKRKPQIKILPINSKDEKVQKLSNKLNKLYRKIKEIEIETGLYDLNIGFPFLSGLTAEGKIIQAPILLMPARLEKHFPKKGQPQWVILQDKNVPVVFNKTLLLALSKFNRCEINNNIYEQEPPDNLYEKTNFMKWVTEILNSNGIACELHEDAFDDEIDKLIEFKVEDFPKEIQPGELKVHQFAVLGHFPQANSSILQDYEHFLSSSQEEISNLLPLLDTELVDDNGIKRDFYNEESVATEGSKTPVNVDHIPENKNVYLLQTDNSQENIILNTKNQKIPGIVVWGPPGTGKSQTIVNLIGNCLSENKTVLVVCQKRAALDVVYDRLDDLGLAYYIALVHDTRKDRKALYNKLESHVVRQKEHTAQDNNYDSLSEEINGQTNKINGVYKFLYSKINKKISPIDIYQSKRVEVPIELVLPLPTSLKKLEDSFYDNLLSAVHDYQRIWRKINIDHPWSERNSFHNLTISDKKIIMSLLDTAINNEKINDFSLVMHVYSDYCIAKSLKQPFTTKFEDSSLAEYLATLSKFKGISKLFKKPYRKCRNKVKSRISEAKKGIVKYKTFLRKGLSKFIKVSKLNSLINNAFEDRENRDIKLSIIPLKNSLDKDFDNLVNLDRQYITMPKQIRLCIDTLVNLTTNGKISFSDDWADIIKAIVFEEWIEKVEGSSTVPNEIRVGNVDNTIQEYRVNIEDKCKTTSIWLDDKLKNQNWSDDFAPLLRKLKGYVTKKRNIPSIRKLNQDFLEHEYHKVTTPCWLVSPETVSEAFPLIKELFDLVIFDEASQCPVKNALPAVFRAKKVVIAGDEKQLPPLTIFESTAIDGMDDELRNIDALEATSLLNLANRVPLYKDAPLCWHYRSEYEELIAFSNHAFYNGMMRTCPNCIIYEGDSSPAIKWTEVKGYWVDRCNEAEADIIIEKVREHFKRDPESSLGVITFNAEQKELILNKIDKMCQEDQEFLALLQENNQRKTDEQLFVKNIENVQGDERDAIIFSIAYAPAEPGGRVVQQFGLLNQEGGENRLNVAITRAKKKVDVVCSVNPEFDLNTSGSRQQGPKLFQKFLIFAKAVSDRDNEKVFSILSEINPNMSVETDRGVLQFDSPFEEEVYNDLRLRNYDVHSQIGQSGFLIDLAIVDPNDPTRYLLGIECDGARYHSSQSARERDVYRQRFLERQGWKIHRIWSTKWWSDKKREIKEIEKLIEELQTSCGGH